MKTLVQDIINDVTVFQTFHKKVPNFHVRYGLQITHHDDLEEALYQMTTCIRHGVEANGI